MIYKLTDGATPEQMRRAGLGDHFTQHDNALYPHDAAGVPWTAAYIQATGDPITDLYENMAAEQKARTTYEHLISLTDDPGVIATLSFLRQREVVHFQRFGETLMLVREYMNKKHVF